jgi:hypothetical protein
VRPQLNGELCGARLIGSGTFQMGRAGFIIIIVINSYSLQVYAALWLDPNFML